MKRKKYLSVIAVMMAVVLACCGETATDTVTTEQQTETIKTEEGSAVENTTGTESASTETTETTETVEISDTLGEGKTYKALCMDMETYESVEGSITVYDNHVVSYKDANGNTFYGFLITDPYGSGDSYSDAIVVIDKSTNTTREFSNLSYMDDNNIPVNLNDATIISFYDNTEYGNIINNFGQLYMVGYTTALPDEVYALFMLSDSQYSIEAGYIAGNCFSYSLSNNELDTNTYNWYGHLAGDSSDYGNIDSITIQNFSTGSGDVFNGTFDAVYVSLYEDDASKNSNENANETTSEKTTQVKKEYDFDISMWDDYLSNASYTDKSKSATDFEDLNNDGIPELFFNPGTDEYVWDIYTMKAIGSKVYKSITIYETEEIMNIENSPYYIYTQYTNLLCNLGLMEIVYSGSNAYSDPIVQAWYKYDTDAEGKYDKKVSGGWITGNYEECDVETAKAEIAKYIGKADAEKYVSEFLERAEKTLSLQE